AFVLALIALAMPALAAEPAPLADGVAMVIQYLAGMVATAVVGWIALAARRFFGISLEGRHREVLHSAATTAASLALSVLAELLARGMDPEKARTVATRHGVDYVRQSVPDALRALKPDDSLLFDMVRAKSAQLELTRSPPLVVDLGDKRPGFQSRG
ncbi:MAG: hypothetical protein DI537_48895, partial [Stutzerimonas stutzeri]